MIDFDKLFQTAALHKGGEDRVRVLLPAAKTPEQLAAQTEAFYLSTMSRRIFRAGLKHSMVDNKWPAFEKAFQGFDPFVCAMMSDDEVDKHMGNRALIRHLRKIKSIRCNAQFMGAIAREHGSFGRWLANWPEDDIVGLWLQLKKKGCQLGGMSGPYFLRMVGKDTFLLTNDVQAVLIAQGIVDRAPSSQKDLRLVEAAFYQWQQESGRSLCEISRVLSLTAALS